jgi:hypothetical protein
MQHLESTAFHSPLARWLRGTAAVVLTLAAPAVSLAEAFTTGLTGTAPAVRFPPCYWVTLLVTTAVTTLAAALAAHLARQDARVITPVTLGIWAITGAAAFGAGRQLSHTGLAQWGVLTVVASLTGIATGVVLAARGEEHHEHAT